MRSRVTFFFVLVEVWWLWFMSCKWVFIRYQNSSHYLKWYWTLLLTLLMCVWTTKSYSLSKAHRIPCKCFDLGQHRREALILDDTSFAWGPVMKRAMVKTKSQWNVKMVKGEVKFSETWYPACRALPPPPKSFLGSFSLSAGQQSQDCFTQL